MLLKIVKQFLFFINFLLLVYQFIIHWEVQQKIRLKKSFQNYTQNSRHKGLIFFTQESKHDICALGGNRVEQKLGYSAGVVSG